MHSILTSELTLFIANMWLYLANALKRGFIPPFLPATLIHYPHVVHPARVKLPLPTTVMLAVLQIYKHDKNQRSCAGNHVIAYIIGPPYTLHRRI